MTHILQQLTSNRLHRLKANKNVSCTRPLLTVLISATLFSVLCSDRFSWDMVQGHLVLPPFLRWMFTAFWGKSLWRCLKDLRMSPVLRWPRLQGCHSPGSLGELKQTVNQLQGLGRSCEKELLPSPWGA